ncbi:amino acid ABC transporter permease [Fusobacterium sp. MFO224]|uniref:amino acid ABC transporter permease n=1 Tax=Fusobacterium sp. MFO224 TaxID=3378070 RepID=UPI003853BC9B
MNMKNIFITKNKDNLSFGKILFNSILLTAFLILIFWISLAKINISFNFFFVNEFKIRIIKGFLMTFYLSLGSLIVSLIIGVVTAVCHNSKILFIRYLAIAYVKFIRGTPLIMQIYLFFYIIGTAWGIDNRFFAGILILSIFEGAYISEIIRGSFISIDNSQLEIAKAVGFTKHQTLKLVIFPQLIARTLPALTGQFSSIIKDSSLLSMIAVIELTQTMREISSLNFKLFECYIFLGLLYLILTLPITYISEILERKFNYEN